MKKKLLGLFAALFGAAFFVVGAFPSRPVKAWAHPREKLVAYTTYFNQKDGGRCENIALAAARIDGIALQPYGEFSFNVVVGERTKKNGYKEAKIISQGEFTLGVGGGVCQVSTTLYNAALLSGLCVTEFHPQSLAVGYVPPSRDAMVSAASDLKLYNPFDETVYFSVRIRENALTVTVYGKNLGRSYSIESKTLARVPAQEPLFVEREEEVREGREGVKSEAYLKTYYGGVLIGIKRLREDFYAPVRGKIIK